MIMQWTYEDPLNIPKDKIRAFIGDTDERFPQLYDEEILLFLQEASDDVRKATYLAAKSLLTKLTLTPDYTIGPETVKYGDRVNALKQLLKELNPATNEGVPIPPPPGEMHFDIGMMDNGPSDYRETLY